MKLEIESAGKRWNVGLREGALFLKIGSAADCEIVIADASPLHAKIENFMGKWSVTDQMSDTGTKLNGETAYSSEIKPGDVIEIGGAKIRVLQGEGAPPPKPQPALYEPPPGLSFKAESLLESIGTAEPVTLREATPAEFKAAVQLDSRAKVSARKPDPPKPAPAGEKTPQQLFAEEMDGQSRQPAPVYQMQNRPTKKGSPVVGYLIVGAIVLCFAGGIISSIIDAMQEEPLGWANGEDPFADVPPSPTATPAPGARPGVDVNRPRPASKRLSAADEKAFRERISKIEKSSDDLETRLAAIDVVIDELKDKQHGLSWDLERTRRNLDIALMTEMSKRFNDVSSAVYDLVQSKQFEVALKQLEDLRAYSQKTDYHKAHLKVTGIGDYLEPKIEEIAALNDAYITEQLIEADRLHALRDFRGAREVVRGLLDRARVESLLEACGEHEVMQLAAWQAEQAAGKREPPAAPFDKKKWKLPPAPKTNLMPEGDAGRWKFISPLTNRLNKAARSGELKGLTTVYHGREAVVGEWKSYRLEMAIKRPMPDETGETHSFTFTLLRQTSELPTATQLALFEQFKEPTRDEFLGMLLFCYDNGLMDDAPRLAWKVWKADAGVKDDLDKLMAAKLGIEVPAGGFIEKDGRLVAP